MARIKSTCFLLSFYFRNSLFSPNLPANVGQRLRRRPRVGQELRSKREHDGVPGKQRPAQGLRQQVSVSLAE